MLSSLALRSFIFHANQRLVLKALRQATPGRLIHGGHGAPRIFFVTLPGGGKTFLAAFCCALFALDGNARNQALRHSTGSRACAAGRGIMSLINYNVNGACGFIRAVLTFDMMLVVGLGSVGS
jgi:hypothetical protein